MGNWRSISMSGTIAAAEVEPLRARLAYSYDRPDGFDNFGPLSFSTERPSLCGIGCWPAAQVNAAGNLAERDYSPEDVRAELERLLEIAPSMILVVHCGGDWESEQCVATIRTGEGLAVLMPPEVEKVTGPSEAQVMGNLVANLYKRG